MGDLLIYISRASRVRHGHVPFPGWNLYDPILTYGGLLAYITTCTYFIPRSQR